MLLVHRTDWVNNKKIMDKIRNFCIIAHIDHGKSTLADRLLELTATVEKRQMQAQVLDKMELEREKGITIKLTPVRMEYGDYILNLIDTPGHVDFSYEVSRSLAACEGALVVIDASQGVQAQTLANIQLAQANNLKLIAVINKIDLPAADIAAAKAQIKALLQTEEESILAVSAKTGEGVEDLLPAIVERIPPPQPAAGQTTQALVFDSYYDDYRGVILYVRLVSGTISSEDEILMMATQTDSLALEVGYLTPEMTATKNLQAGEIGYVVTNLKTTSEARVGDTLTLKVQPSSRALAGYQPAKTYIYAGLFPQDSSAYANLKKALEKLTLADSTLVYEIENSPILGHGFRCGFLGLLHLDITTERLKREYDLELIISNPSTAYEVSLTDGQKIIVKTADQLPEPSKIEILKEPWVSGEIVCLQPQVGAMIQLLTKARGVVGDISYVKQLAIIKFEAPLANLLTDFYDRLKSLSSGYGSLNYDFCGYRQEDLVRVDFYVAHEMVGALSTICHRSEAVALGQRVVQKLKDIIPRQQFKVALQAAIGGKFIARADIPSFRKDVTAKLYGGDFTRRQKLLQQQKKGKSRMKKVGRVELPPAAFTVLLQKE